MKTIKLQVSDSNGAVTGGLPSIWAEISIEEQVEVGDGVGHGIKFKTRSAWLLITKHFIYYLGQYHQIDSIESDAEDRFFEVTALTFAGVN